MLFLSKPQDILAIIGSTVVVGKVVVVVKAFNSLRTSAGNKAQFDCVYDMSSIAMSPSSFVPRIPTNIILKNNFM